MKRLSMLVALLICGIAVGCGGEKKNGTGDKGDKGENKAPKDMPKVTPKTKPAEATKDEPKKEEAKKDEGAKDEGAKDEGAKDEGAKDEGAKEEGGEGEKDGEGGEEKKE